MQTSFDPDLIKMMRCPVSQSELTIASDELVKSLNQQIDSGQLMNQVGQPIESRIDSGFLNADESLLLPIRGGIVILVVDQAIPLQPNSKKEKE